MRDGAMLTGKRVAMLVEDGFEDRELTGPLDTLRAAGATVTIVGPTAGAQFTGKRGESIVTVAPAARNASSGPVSSRSSNPSSTSIATRLPVSTARSLMWRLYPNVIMVK